VLQHIRGWLAIAVVAGLPLACTPGTHDDDTWQDDDASGDDDTSGDDDAGDDDTGDDDTGDDDDVEHDYSCAPVGAGYSDGFFALKGFAGALYAGQFGYGHESQSMLYRYPPWELVQPGLTGISESVCALLEFDGHLYANTESSGDIFRSGDGSTWERVHDGGSHTIGCGLEVFGGQLYAVNYDNGDHEHGRILRSADGTSWDTVYDSGGTSLYIREIVAHDGWIHAFAVDEDSLQGYALASTDGVSWTPTETPSRFFRGHSWGGYLWIASTDRTSNGAPGIWRFDGTDTVQVHHETKHYVTELTDFDGALFAGTSDGWKDDVGTSSLLMSRDGSSWETVCDFPELAAWSIATSGDHLYVGTWQYGDGGQVYEVSIVEVPSDDDDDDTGTDVDCAAISAANPAWEVCETGPGFCAGVFTDGAGCAAYCAPAGLACTARFGGEPGCIKEPENVWDCAADNGHQSDWCESG